MLSRQIISHIYFHHSYLTCQRELHNLILFCLFKMLEGFKGPFALNAGFEPQMEDVNNKALS